MHTVGLAEETVDAALLSTTLEGIVRASGPTTNPAQEGEDRSQQGPRQVCEVSRDSTYSHADLPSIIPEGQEATGIETYNLLRDKGWRTITELCRGETRAPDQLKRTILEEHPEEAIRYRFGERTTYLVSPGLRVPPLRNKKHNLQDAQQSAQRLDTTTPRRRQTKTSDNDADGRTLAGIVDASERDAAPKAKWLRYSQEKVLELHRELQYTHDTVPVVPEGAEITGEQAFHLLRAQGWLNITELGEKEQRNPYRLKDVILMRQPSDAVLYRFGKKMVYLFRPDMEIPPLQNKKHDALRAAPAQESKPKRLRDPRALERVLEIDRDGQYTHEQLQQIPQGQQLSGKEVCALLTAAGWSKTTKLSKQERRTADGFRRTLLMNHPEDAIRYRAGQCTTYLFSPDIDIRPRQNLPGAMPDSPEGVAQRLDTTAGRVRTLAQKLQLGKRNGRLVLSESHAAAIGRILQSERRQHKQLLKSIKKRTMYSLAELQELGVPTTHFRDRIQHGLLAERDGRHVVAGHEVLRYLREEYDPSYLSVGLRLLVRDRPQLYDIATIVKETGLPRHVVGQRLGRLADEQPESCFRLITPSSQTRTLATKDSLDAIVDWEQRGERQLLRLLDRYPLPSQHEAATYAIAGLRELIDDEGMIPFGAIRQAFDHLRTLKEYGKQAVRVSRASVALKDLVLLHEYLKQHNYIGLQLDKRITTEEIGWMMAGTPAAAVQDAITAGEEALFLSNAYLIDNFRPHRNVEDYEPLAATQLMRLVRAHNPTPEVEFPVVAGHYLDLIARRVARCDPRMDEEHASVGSATLCPEPLPRSASRPESYVIRNDYSAKIREALCGTLHNGDLEFVMARFGIGQPALSNQELRERFGPDTAAMESRTLRALQQNKSLQKIMAELR